MRSIHCTALPTITIPATTPSPKAVYSRTSVNASNSVASSSANQRTVDSVATTSLAVVNTVKKHYPDIRTRASVNMRIGTVTAMEYVAHLFDEYCVQREYNRDPEHLRELRTWADANGKRLSLLMQQAQLQAQAA